MPLRIGERLSHAQRLSAAAANTTLCNANPRGLERMQKLLGNSRPVNLLSEWRLVHPCRYDGAVSLLGMTPFHGLILLALRWLGSYDVWGVGPQDFYAGYEIDYSNRTRGGGCATASYYTGPGEAPPRDGIR